MYFSQKLNSNPTQSEPKYYLFCSIIQPDQPKHLPLNVKYVVSSNNIKSNAGLNFVDNIVQCHTECSDVLLSRKMSHQRHQNPPTT